MLLNPNYQGMKADVWSMGCIFLELLIGNELFWNHWMVSYDVEVLQDKNRFRSEIGTSTEELPSILNFSATLNAFLIAILQVNPEKRPTAQAVFDMDWLHDSNSEQLPPELLVPTVSFGGEESTGSSNKLLLLSSPSVSKNMLKTAVSNREKQRTNGAAPAGGGEYPLPMFGGIEQQTPTITKARKIIQRGDEIHKNGTDRFFPATSSSTNNLREPQKPAI
jgi:serine/threonine protein kinase